jgi:hypothetical protein
MKQFFALVALVALVSCGGSTTTETTKTDSTSVKCDSTKCDSIKCDSTKVDTITTEEALKYTVK